MAKASRRNRVQVKPQLELVTTQPDRKAFIAPPPLRPQTEAQRLLLSSLRSNTLTLSKGSAGVGKTYVALSYAADLIKNHAIERIILTRPLVGVGGEERLIGALPNDLMAKMAPWVLPMLDCLEERLGKTHVEYLIGHDKLRVAPLAFMRGSSFTDTFVHCTESQNCTPEQVKMLLTRIGGGSKVCVEGDPRQSDLRGTNGLDDAIGRLQDLHGVGVVTFTRADVVRSGFCQQVLERYEI